MKEWVVRSNQAAEVFSVPKVRTKMESWVLDQRQKIATHVYVSVFEWTLAFDTRGYFPKIKAPTLILATKRSFVVSMEEQQFVQKQTPNSKLLIFEEPQIHMIIPERCADAVLNFVQSLD
jgi:pimeloyl-ACP methyl ester carboxylesterase